MELFSRRLRPRESTADRLAALEDYVEYLRQQSEYGADRTEERLAALEGAGEPL